MARFLVAEDDPQAREMIVRICAFQGHQVEEVRDAVRALAVFEDFAPDLIITDLAMPLGSGQHLVRELRERYGAKAPPVIVITGYAAALGEKEKEELSAHAILEKPVDVAPMLEALQAVLG